MQASSIILISLLLIMSPLFAQEETDSPGPEPIQFNGYEGVRPFKIVAGKEEEPIRRCSLCHNILPLNREIRVLTKAPHLGEANHGDGRVWCLSCHHADDRIYLTTLLGEKVNFDRADLVCGGCHANRHKDWFFGGHGKRLTNWQGERQIYACTYCHDAHDPAIKPREPSRPPNVRPGLAREAGTPHTQQRLWERYSSRTEPGISNE